LPIQLLQDQQTTWTNQSDELTTIDGLLTNLQTAVQSVQSAMDGSSYTASYSTDGVVAASLDDTAQEGVYPIEVQSIGSYASGSTDSDWGTPAANATFNLMVDNTAYAISSTDTSATGVASAINSQYGNMVQATVLNAGSGTTADTRISLQAVALGQQTLDIQDSSGDSLFGSSGQTVAGSQAEYSIPGTGAANILTNSRQVVISPGVTLTLQSAAPDTEVDTTISRPDSTLSTALSSFTTAYNAVATELTNQYGQDGQSSPGVLEGNPILQTISQALSQIGTYGQSSGAVNSLENLGLDLGINGQMKFTALDLAATDIGDSSAVDEFLGNSTSSGFLQAATNALTSLEDPTTGVVKNTESDLQTEITNIGNTISTKQAAVVTMTTNLTNQMAQADALLSTSEQQYSYMTELFQAQQTEEQELAL
jgi:flagellar hook-associated protein 2